MSHLITALPNPNADEFTFGMRNPYYKLAPGEVDTFPCQQDYRIAFVTRSAMDPLNRRIYELLGVPKFWDGCCGSGNGDWFSLAEVEDAFSSLVYGPDGKQLHPEYEFLATVLAYMNRCQQRVFIRFR